MDSLVIANLFLLLFLGLADNQMIAALLPALVQLIVPGISVSTAGLLVVVYTLRLRRWRHFFLGHALRPLRAAAIPAGRGCLLCRGFRCLISKAAP